MLALDILAKGFKFEDCITNFPASHSHEDFVQKMKKNYERVNVAKSSSIKDKLQMGGLTRMIEAIINKSNECKVDRNVKY